MASVTQHDKAIQKYRQFVDYMCLLTGDQPAEYSIHLDANSQVIEHRLLGIFVHDERLKSFVTRLSRINTLLEYIKNSQ